MENLDLNLLPHLRALLETRSVTRAAEQVGHGQPAMSASLRKLRIHFNDPLLVRAGRGHDLTPLAAALIPLVRSTMDGVSRVLDAGASFDEATSERRFTIAASDFAGSVLLPPITALLGNRAPQVTLRATPLPQSAPGELELRAADVLVAPEGYAFPGRRRHLFTDVFVALMDAAHPLVDARAPTVADLGRFPHAVTDFGVAMPSPAGRHLDEHGVRPRVAVSVPGMLALPSVVRGTHLLALVPSLLAAAWSSGGGLAVLRFPEGEEPQLGESLHWSPAAEIDPGSLWVRDLVVEAAATLRPPDGVGSRAMAR